MVVDIKMERKLGKIKTKEINKKTEKLLLTSDAPKIIAERKMIERGKKNTPNRCIKQRIRS